MLRDPGGGTAASVSDVAANFEGGAGHDLRSSAFAAFPGS